MQISSWSKQETWIHCQNPCFNFVWLVQSENFVTFPANTQNIIRLSVHEVYDAHLLMRPRVHMFHELRYVFKGGEADLKQEKNRKGALATQKMNEGHFWSKSCSSPHLTWVEDCSLLLLNRKLLPLFEYHVDSDHISSRHITIARIGGEGRLVGLFFHYQFYSGVLCIRCPFPGVGQNACLRVILQPWQTHGDPHTPPKTRLCRETNAAIALKSEADISESVFPTPSLNVFHVCVASLRTSQLQL